MSNNVERLPDTPKSAPGSVEAYKPSRHQVPGFLMPDSFEAIEKLAEKFCRAGWVPKSYQDKQGNPNQAAVEVGIMAGLTFGMQPLAALQSIAVINGTPALWGDGLLAVVRESGLMENFKEGMEKDDEEGMSAFCTVKRRGEEPQTRKFNKTMAERAGLWKKQGPWSQYPTRMMQMRARSWALRDTFADVLRGMHCVEEVMDMGEVAFTDAPPPPSRADFKEPEPEELFAIVTYDGNTVQCGVDDIVSTLDEALGDCTSEAMLEGVWESSDMDSIRARLAELGRNDVIENIHLTREGQWIRVGEQTNAQREELTPESEPESIPPQDERTEADLLGSG